MFNKIKEKIISNLESKASCECSVETKKVDSCCDASKNCCESDNDCCDTKCC